jgi:hypothetical protein
VSVEGEKAEEDQRGKEASESGSHRRPAITETRLKTSSAAEERGIGSILLIMAGPASGQDFEGGRREQLHRFSGDSGKAWNDDQIEVKGDHG